MKFALIGRSISHSLSPMLYKKIIGPHVQYDLLDYAEDSQLPQLSELAKKYTGVNITTPYKLHYINEVMITDPVVKELGSINTISFTDNGVLATNTDLVAVRQILKGLKEKYKDAHFILLGSGVMAKLTVLAFKEQALNFVQLSRKTNPDLSKMDLTAFEKSNVQNIVINACSRSFVFEGKQSDKNIFWDYNYSFIPHQNTLPFRVKEYHDGQEMLFLQAQAAWKFWSAK